MSAHTHSAEAHRRAVEKYNKKTYAQIRIRLNKEKDAEILDVMNKLQGEGMSYRDILLEWYSAWLDTDKAIK